MYFEYGENEILYLKSKDRKLAEVIEKIGLIKRETDTDLFSSVIHHIIGQQISTKAQTTIWQRMKKDLTEVTAETILSVDISKLQSYGMTFRKAEYITDFSENLAIQRGLRMVYHHRNIDRKLFEKYRRRFSPYCSVASLYLWAVAGGAIPEMKDYKPKTTKKEKK